MKKIFIGKDNLLRGGWQIVACLLTEIIAMLLLQIVFGSILHIVFGNQLSGSVNLLCGAILNILLAIILVFVFTKINHTSVRSIGVDSSSKSWKQFMLGSVVGALCIVVIAVISYAIKDYHIVKVEFTPMLIIYFLYYVSVGISEETLCRGFMQHALTPRWGAIPAILFPSVMFGALHLMNPNFSVIAMINTALIGIVFAIFTFQYDNLAAAVGFHIFWNFFLGNIFGVSVSGGNQEASLLQVVKDQDTIWTGGNYGFEGGIICTILIILILILQLLFLNKRPMIKKTNELANGEQTL